RVLTTMTWNVASLAVYIFGAVTFCVLAVSYWTQRRTRSFGPFAAFTLVCAVAFVANLLSQLEWLESAPLALIRNLPAGLLPPLILHVVWTEGGRWRRAALALFYAVGTAAALALEVQGPEILYLAPALLLAVGTAAAILVRRHQHRPI